MKKIILYFLVLILFIFLPLFWRLRAILQVQGIGFFSIIIISWLVIRSRKESDFQIPKFIPPLILFLVLQVVLLLISPVQSTGYLWIILELIVMVFFFFILDNHKSDQGRRFWENILIGAGILYASLDIYYIQAFYFNWGKINGSLFPLPPLTIRVPGMILGHANILSSYLNLVIPLALIRLVGNVRKSERIFWAVILTILLITNYFTYSRSGWLALAGGLLVTLVLVYANRLNFQIDFRRLLRKSITNRLWILWGAVGSIAFVSLFIFIRSQLQTSKHGTIAGRIDIYKYVIGWISYSPIWGNGTGSTSSLFALRGYAIGGDEIYDAHNLWLQVALESGILGLSLLLIVVGFIALAYRSAWLDWREDPDKRASLAAYTGIGVAVFVNSLLNIAFDKLIYDLALATIIALVYTLAPRREFLLVNKKTAIAILAAILIICIIGLANFERSMIPYSKGKIAANEGDWLSARDNICQAADFDNKNAFYSFQCGLANAIVAADNDDINTLSEAIRYQKHGLGINPQWYIHWANLASYEWAIGDRDAAIDHMQRAFELAPNRNFLRANLAWMAEQQGEISEAYKYYQIAYCLNPGYEGVISFERSHLFQQAAEDECQPKYDKISNSDYLKYLRSGLQSYQTGDLGEAELLFQQAAKTNIQSGVPYAYLALIDQQNGKIESSNRNIQTALLFEYNSATIHRIAADIADMNGNQDLWFKHLKIAFTLNERRTLSSNYYWYSYFDLGLPTDLSPLLPFVNISHDWIKDLKGLADYLKDNDDEELLLRVNQMIERYGSVQEEQ